MSEITADPKTWPEPNYDNPHTRVPAILGTLIPLTIITTLFWGVRIWGRTTTKAYIGLDDWLMSAAAILATSTCVALCVLTKYGAGYHIWDVRPEWGPSFAKVQLVSDPIFMLSISITKISICTTYLRLFPSRTDKIFCYVLIAYNVGYALSVPWVMIFQCTPVARFWDPEVPGSCIDFGAMLLATGITNSLSDCFVYLWPIRALWQVQLPMKQRLGLMVMFGFGIVVCLIGIIRMWYVEAFFENFDVYWGSGPGTILTGTEACIGVICGCIPGIKPILALLFPRLFSSYDRSNSRPTGAYGKTSTHGHGVSAHGRSRLSHHPGGQSFPFQTLSGGDDGLIAAHHGAGGTSTASKKGSVAVTTTTVASTPDSASDTDVERLGASPGPRAQVPLGPLSPTTAPGAVGAAPRNNFAWALGAADDVAVAAGRQVPEGRIGVEQQVSVSVSEAVDGGATAITTTAKGPGRDNESEEWIIPEDQRR